MTEERKKEEQQKLPKRPAFGGLDRQYATVGGTKRSGRQDASASRTSAGQEEEHQEAQLPSSSNIQAVKQPTFQVASGLDTQEVKHPESQQAERQETQIASYSEAQMGNHLAIQQVSSPNTQQVSTQDSQPLRMQEGQTLSNSSTQTEERSTIQEASSSSAQAVKLRERQLLRGREGQMLEHTATQIARGSDVKQAEKPERKKRTIYLEPDVDRWIRHRIADTEEEISEVVNLAVRRLMRPE